MVRFPKNTLLGAEPYTWGYHDELKGPRSEIRPWTSLQPNHNFSLPLVAQPILSRFMWFAGHLDLLVCQHSFDSCFFILGLLFPCNDLHAISWSCGSLDYIFGSALGFLHSPPGNCPHVFWYGPKHWTRRCLIRQEVESTLKSICRMRLEIILVHRK